MPGPAIRDIPRGHFACGGRLRDAQDSKQKSGSGLKYKPLISRQPASRNPSARAINWLTLATVKPISAAKAVIVRPLSV
jgi:hypothetical protein